MPVSFHSHSGLYCQHAHGNLDEVLHRVKDLKFLVFGFSEHIPRLLPSELYPEEIELNYTPDTLTQMYNNFISKARTLQSQTFQQIATGEKNLPVLLVGLETEYTTTESLNLVQTIRQQYDLDYIVGSVHHVLEIPIDYSTEMYLDAAKKSYQHITSQGMDLEYVPPPVEYSGSVSGSWSVEIEALFICYFDAQFTMLKILKPEVVGHFDLIRIFNPTHNISAKVWERIKRNTAFIVEYGGLVELNSRAYKKGLPDAYPFRDIVKVMKEMNVKFTICDDSHGPNDIAMHYDKLYGYLEEMQIDTIHYLTVDDEYLKNYTTGSLPYKNIIVKQLDDVSNHQFWKQII
ncbi:histidinolphosphatase [Nowakowskiella sp. JEL0407]|nr:histidinolphosphatase [Nowakowskiella sp. JEL0407]